MKFAFLICSFNYESEFSMNAPAGKVKKFFSDNYVETAEGFDLQKSVFADGSWLPDFGTV